MIRPEFIEALEAAALGAPSQGITYAICSSPNDILELLRYVKVLERAFKCIDGGEKNFDHLMECAARELTESETVAKESK